MFPERVARLHPKYRTPTLAIVIQAAWATVLALSGTYGQLLDYVVFGDWIFFGLAGATVFVFRARERGAGRTPSPVYRLPGYPFVPGLFVVTALFIVLSSIWSNPGNAAIGMVLIGAGVPVWGWWRRSNPS